jgi:hypothetical protein
MVDTLTVIAATAPGPQGFKGQAQIALLTSPGVARNVEEMLMRKSIVSAPKSEPVPKTDSAQMPVSVAEPCFGFPWLSFQCSYREYALRDGKTHVKASDCRYDGATLVREEFQGVAGPEVFPKSVASIMEQVGHMQSQMLKLWQPWLGWPPTARNAQDRGDSEE